MGYSNHEPQGNGKFAYISNGKIVTYVDGKRTEYSALSGHLLSLDLEMDTYDGREYEKIVLFMKDENNDDFVLSFSMENGYGQSFCKMIKNCDLKMPMEISASLEPDPKNPKNKGFAKLFIKQPDASGKWSNVKWAYTKDNPGKMPEPVTVKVNNKDVKDYTKRNDFFRKLLVDLIYKQLKKLHPEFNVADAKKKETAKSKDITEPIDDLPF